MNYCHDQIAPNQFNAALRTERVDGDWLCRGVRGFFVAASQPRSSAK
jgi:hypothetical protein